jgi:hypothetical protein
MWDPTVNYFLKFFSWFKAIPKKYRRLVGQPILPGTRIDQHDDPAVFSQNQKFHLTMQRDGNFVLYDSNGPKWATNTHTRCSGRCYIVYQQDGNLVVYTLNLFEGLRAIWASNTVRSNPGPLFLHNHGNLVMYTYMPANPLTTDDYENCYYNNYCGLSYSWQTKTHFQGQNLNRKRDASKTNKTDNANILLKF